MKLKLPRDVPPRPRGVLAAGPQPPPIHGAAIVNQHGIKQLIAAGRTVWICDTGAGAQRKTPGYHLLRLTANSRACALLILRARHLDILYITGAAGGGLWYQSAQIMLARLLRIGIVFHHHSSQYLENPAPAMRFIIALTARRAIHIVLCTQMARALIDVYPRATRLDIRAVPNAWVVDSESFGEGSLAAGHRSEIVLGHLSNLSDQKGFADVVAVYRELSAAGEPVRLEIAGPATDSNSRQLLRALEGDADVRYWGALRRDQVMGFMGGIDVFLFLGRGRDGDPLVVNEAHASGCIVFAARSGCLQEVVEETGMSVANGSAYASHLKTLLASADLSSSARVARKEFHRIAATRSLNTFLASFD